MIYLYDEAIANDLRNSLNLSNISCPIKVIDKEAIIDITAQIKEDRISFPLICLKRHEDTPIDTDLTNFTAMHKGVPAVFDNETNKIYNEKSIPIKLSYDLIILTTNTADKDELVRELLSKYINMYFITFTLPYESKRKLKFGVKVIDDSISNVSGSYEYIKSGTLYETTISLEVQGARLLSYTPRQLQRTVLSKDIVIKEP